MTRLCLRGLRLTTSEEAREFASATVIDILAPAVGNTHGLSRSMIRGEAQKRLDIGRIAEIAKATGLFMTLHGASGTNDEDLRRAIQAGITENTYQHRIAPCMAARFGGGIGERSGSNCSI